jgi:hypothetical protein
MKNGSFVLGKIELDDELLDRDLEVMSSFSEIREEYDEYSSGYWKNYSLWNCSGDSEDTLYKDYDVPARLTAHGEKLGYINRLVRENFDLTHLKMVRARNLINAVIIPHKDFVELEKDPSQYFRVFITLEENKDSFHSDEHQVFHMRKGEVWFLDASIVHAACNFSNESRMCICLDFQFPGSFQPSDIFANKRIYDDRIAPHTLHREGVDQEFTQALMGLSRLINRSNFKDMVMVLSKMHFTRDVPISVTYDWLVDIARQSGDKAIEDKALHMRKYLTVERGLKERFSWHEW